MTPKEKAKFEGRQFAIIFVLPMKFSKNKKINRLSNKLNTPFSLVFSNDLTKSILFYTFYDPAYFISGTWGEKINEYNIEMSNYMVELNKITKLYDKSLKTKTVKTKSL